MVYLGVKEVAYREIASSTFTHLHSLSVQWHLNRRIGVVVRAMDRGISSAATVVDWLFLRLVPTLLEAIIVFIIFTVVYDALYAAITLLVGFTVYMTLTYFMSEWRRKIRMRLNDMDNQASAVYVDALTNFEVVKAFTNEAWELGRYDRAVQRHQAATRHVQISLGALNSSQQFIIRLTQLVIYLLAGAQVVDGNITVGDFVALTGFVLAVFGPLEFMGMVFSLTVTAYADMTNLSDLLREKPDIVDAPDANELVLEAGGAVTPPSASGDATEPPVALPAKAPAFLPPSVEFKNVSFAYPAQSQSFIDQRTAARKRAEAKRKAGAAGKDADTAAPPVAEQAPAASAADVQVVVPDSPRYVLKDVSFTVQPGTTTAIVGATGSGKSTIARLLFRFYDVTSGSILVNGQAVNGNPEVTAHSLRSAIGLIPQDTALFHDTIGYNIAYGRPGAPDALLQQAVRDAALDEFVADLPKGLDTKVGERGLRVSGGERQRISIARVLLKDAPILVADEATSALDSVTEARVQAAISRAQFGRTVLVIAHRLSTIRDADQILVLDKGEVVERGNHAELLATGGKYAELWRQQDADGGGEAQGSQEGAE